MILITIVYIYIGGGIFDYNVLQCSSCYQDVSRAHRAKSLKVLGLKKNGNVFFGNGEQLDLAMWRKSVDADYGEQRHHGRHSRSNVLTMIFHAFV